MNSAATFSIEEFERSSWMRFISSCPEAHPFHHPYWISFISGCYGYRPFQAVVRNQEGEITAGIPIMEINSILGRRKWVSLPFSDHCRPLFRSDNALSILMNGLISEARNGIIDSLALRWGYDSPDLFLSNDHVLTTTHLTTSPEAIRARIKGNDFRKVRLGARREIECIRSTSLEAMQIYFRLHLETRRRLGVPSQPWRFFRLFWEQIIAQGLGFVSLARKNGEYLAGIVFIHWNKTLVYKFAASSKNGRQLAAAYPLTWDAITWACENGFQILDWGRSDLEDQGLRDFKNRWASEESDLVYSSNRQSSPVFLGKVYPLIHQIISHSPIWVCRVSGELFYRYYG